MKGVSGRCHCTCSNVHGSQGRCTRCGIWYWKCVNHSTLVQWFFFTTDPKHSKNLFFLMLIGIFLKTVSTLISLKYFISLFSFLLKPHKFCLIPFFSHVILADLSFHFIDRPLNLCFKFIPEGIIFPALRKQQ